MLRGEPEFLERPFKNEHDTPLSRLGFKQAYETGIYIREKLLGSLPEKVKLSVYSSPFTRCL
jgi:broad specificity phosphatase PhoE